ncbi:Structural maintenance of chromosomes protein 4 [Exaiptasia diaphana]|nr:Structural maintenance of chromosomes protein 4 [Exaiptasia diaphana]
MDKKKVANDAKSKVDVAQSELEVYKSQNESAMSHLREMRNKLESVIQEHQTKNSEMKSLEDDLQETKKKYADSQKDFLKGVMKEEEIMHKIKRHKATLGGSRRTEMILEVLIKQKELGNIKGQIYGRLVDLGSPIDDKYDIAIFTSCGEALDIIICDTMETAIACAKYIEDHNLATATMIGLDTMLKWKKASSVKIETPDNVPRLYDLVHVQDPKISPVFYYALGNILVADNLDIASKIASQGNKRWRVVTLEGDIVERDGVIIKPARRDAAEIQILSVELKKQLKEIEQVLKKSANEYAAVEAKEQVLREKEVDIKHEVEKFDGILNENHHKVKHWKNEEEAYLARVRELDQVTSDRNKKRHEHEALQKTRLDEFMAGFTFITSTLKEMYRMITLGGDAELELVDSLDPFSEGIVFSVRPENETWKNISNLSGGEKTLSSLALVRNA